MDRLTRIVVEAVHKARAQMATSKATWSDASFDELPDRQKRRCIAIANSVVSALRNNGILAEPQRIRKPFGQYRVLRRRGGQ